MTVPTMMNCPHQGEGWCLKCVGKVAIHLEAAKVEVARLNLLLVRKNEALSLFADSKMWERALSPNGIGTNWIWYGDGDGVYRNPVGLARKEMEADEPTDD